ncbi:unnamed protein product [Mucor fragilis]
MKSRESIPCGSPIIKQDILEEYIHKRSQSFDDHGLSQVKDALSFANFILGQEDSNRCAKYEESDTNARILNEPDASDSVDNDYIKIKQEDVAKYDIDVHASMIESSSSSLRSTEPDINDPNFHCSSCNFTYKSQPRYWKHLRRTHNIIQTSRYPINHDILPDWNDPNCHCRSCNRSYSSRANYNYHCRHIHGMEKPVKLETDFPDANDPNNYCKQPLNLTVNIFLLFTKWIGDKFQTSRKMSQMWMTRTFIAVFAIGICQTSTPSSLIYSKYTRYFNQHQRRKTTQNQIQTIPTITAFHVTRLSVTKANIEGTFVRHII